MPKNRKGDPSGFLNTHSVVKYQRNWRGDSLERKNIEKSLTMPKNCQWKGGPLEVFQHPFCRKTAKELKGVPFGEKIFPEKSLPVPKKNRKVGTLWSRPVWYVTRENRKTPFWFSSLGQMVQYFVELLRTILVSSCGLKKRVTIIVTFHFMKRQLKIKLGQWSLL